jgi:hypothetical protein
LKCIRFTLFTIAAFFIAANDKTAARELLQFTFDVHGYKEHMKIFYNCDQRLFQTRETWTLHHAFTSFEHFLRTIQHILDQARDVQYGDVMNTMDIHQEFEDCIITLSDGVEQYGNKHFIIKLKLNDDDIHAWICAFGVKSDKWIDLKNGSKMNEKYIEANCFSR